LQLFEFYSKFENGRGGTCCIVNQQCDVNCGMAYRAGDPHHFPYRPPGDDAQWHWPPPFYITCSPSRWSAPDEAAITNRSHPTSPPQASPAASVQQSIDSKYHDRRIYHVMRVTLMWPPGVRRRSGWGRPRRVRIAAKTIANRF